MLLCTDHVTSFTASIVVFTSQQTGCNACAQNIPIPRSVCEVRGGRKLSKQAANSAGAIHIANKDLISDVSNVRACLGVLPPHGVIHAQERQGLTGQLEITMETMAKPESGC